MLLWPLHCHFSEILKIRCGREERSCEKNVHKKHFHFQRTSFPIQLSHPLTKGWDGILLAEQGPDGAPHPPPGLAHHPCSRIHPSPCAGSSSAKAHLDRPDPKPEVGQVQILALWEQR